MQRFAMSTRAVTGRYHDTTIGQQWNAHDIDRWLNHVFANDDPACDDMPEVQAWAVDADQDGWAVCGAPGCGELCHAEKWLYRSSGFISGVNGTRAPDTRIYSPFICLCTPWGGS